MESTNAPGVVSEVPSEPDPEIAADGEVASRQGWAWALVVIGMALLLAACAALALVAAGRAPVGAPG